MKAWLSMTDIFNEHYNQLTQFERDVITSTDYASANMKMFTSLFDFKDYVKICYEFSDTIK